MRLVCNCPNFGRPDVKGSGGSTPMLRHHFRTATAVVIVVTVLGGVLWQPTPASEPDDWQITDLDAGRPESSDIAIDGSGNALAVWATGARIRVARYAVASGAWSPAITLSNTADISFKPQVAANAAGDAIAVWSGSENPDEPQYVALSRYAAATNTWAPALEFATYGDWPRVVIDEHGNATVIWAEILRYEVDDFYYYPYPVYEIRSARYDASTAAWSSPVTLSGEYAWAHRIGIDPAGNVTVVWFREGFIEARRLPSGADHWTPTTRLGMASLVLVDLVVDRHGDVIAAWPLHETPNRPVALYGARFSADAAAWSQPFVIAAPWSDGISMDADAAGNVTIVYSVSSGFATPSTLRSISYVRSTNSWSGPTDIATNVYPSAQVAVDPAGSATVVWLTPGFLHLAQRSPAGTWNTIQKTDASPSMSPRLAADVAGNLFVLWVNAGAFPALKAARGTAGLAPPAIRQVISTSGTLSIDFTQPPVLGPDHAVLNYEYSTDNGVTWVARNPASTSSPLVIDGLIDGVAYPVRLRAILNQGSGRASEASMLTPGLAAPANLRVASLIGNLLTLAWSPPTSGVPPTGYIVEGTASGQPLAARLPVAGTGTIYSVAAPNGVFQARVRATIGQAESEPSNEITFNVGVPAPPSAPTNLLGLADGTTVVLTWQNTVSGGAATGIVLDVAGQATGSIPLPLTDRFTFADVPPGTYSVTVRAVNASGSSGSSNAVTLTVPGSCAPPATPTGFAVAKNGNTIVLAWSPPASGAAPEGYVVLVSGSFTGSLPTSALTFSSAASPGTYSLSVAATNACGSSAATPAKTVTIP
jgi:hypothetical protein